MSQDTGARREAYSEGIKDLLADFLLLSIVCVASVQIKRYIPLHVTMDGVGTFPVLSSS